MREISELFDLDQIDPSLNRQQREREGFSDEPRITPTRPYRRAAPFTCRLDSGKVGAAQSDPSSKQIAACGDHVGTCIKQGNDVINKFIFAESGSSLTP